MTPKITNVRAKPKELLGQMRGGKLYQRAYEEGMSLSAWLEIEDPSDQYNDGTDAFTRLLEVSDIFVRSIPEMGLWSDKFEVFESSDDTRALVPEWIARIQRGVAYGKKPSTDSMKKAREIFLSSDYPVNTLFKKYTDDLTPVIEQVQPQIPLSSLVARMTGIRGTDYRALYLTRVEGDLQMVRVVEATEVPKSKLSGGQRTITLHKYGRALETSYEQLRRMDIDLIQTFLQLLAVQAEVDKADFAMSVLVNGDGNAGTAPVSYNLTTLDPAATAGTLTLKGYLRYKMKFRNPYVITTILAQEEAALQAMLLNTGSANVPLVNVSAQLGFGGFTPINPGLADNVALGWMDDAPALKLVGFDRRMALEYVTEIGGDITEVQKFANRQTNEIIMTTVDGFRTLDGNGTRLLDINA